MTKSGIQTHSRSILIPMYSANAHQYCVYTYFACLGNHDFIQVKCTLVQALRLCTGRTDHRGSRGIVLLFLDHDTRRGWGVSVTLRPLFTPGKDPVPIVQDADIFQLPLRNWHLLPRCGFTPQRKFIFFYFIHNKFVVMHRQQRLYSIPISLCLS